MAAIATARGTTVQTVKPNNPTVSRHIPYLATYLILRIIQTCFAITVIGLSANLLAIDAKHHGHYAPGQFLNLYTPSPSVKHGFKLSAPLAMLLLGAIFTFLACVLELVLLCSSLGTATKLIGVNKSIIYFVFVAVDIAMIFILIIGVTLIGKYITFQEWWNSPPKLPFVSFNKGCFVLGFLMILSFAMTAIIACMVAVYTRRKEKMEASGAQLEHGPGNNLRDGEIPIEDEPARESMNDDMSEAEIVREEEQRELAVRYFLSDVISIGPKNARTKQLGYYNVIGGGFSKPATGGTLSLARHRDAMGRVEWFCIPDSYIGASTGRVEELSVQANDAVYNSTRTQHTWRRTFIRPMGAYALRAANWPFSGVSANRGLWNEKDGIFIALRWIPACLIASFCLPFARTEANIRPDGKYRDFPYRYWTYPHASRNPKEDSLPAHFQDEEEEEEEGLGHFYSEAKHERILRPRLLCHLENPESKDLHGIAYVSSDEDERLPEERRGVPYVFVAYTADQFSNNSNEDLKALSTIAEMATRHAGLSAYWIAASCFVEEYQREDVYRISDVIRGAHSVVIVLGQPCNSRAQAELEALEEKPKDKSTEELLQDWGRRMWTFPEALLCPSDKIKVYLRSGNAVTHVDTISKQDFPGRAWHDKLISRQLMDHFLGSLTLSRLEIVVIALECLRGRKTTLTRETMDGELTYVLMGLLRRRPKPRKDDSAFQAFAKLSLSNDSDRYLERLICVQPTGTANRERTGNELLTARDVWGCCLWDIYPLCQVAAIGHGDSVILDGCSGAAIKWDRFESAPRIRGYSYRRFFIKLWLRLCPILFLVGAIITQWANESAGGIILAIASLTIFFYPILIIRAHSGKVWDTQAELFGFEGYVDIRTIECLIWGFEDGRLDWSICGSSLSRHSFNADNECIGRDPTDDPLVKARVKLHEKGQMQHKRIFTIVDTKTMQVSLIEAVHPPVLALACGKEGGMVRSVLCSFDYKTNTVYREAVLRMESRVLSKMNHIGRICFGVSRPTPDPRPSPTIPGGIPTMPPIPRNPRALDTPSTPATTFSWEAMGRAIKSGFSKCISSLTPETSSGIENENVR